MCTESPKIDKSQLKPEPAINTNEDKAPIQNGNLTKQNENTTTNNNYNQTNDIKDKCQTETTNVNRKSPDTRTKDYVTYQNKHQTCDRRLSKTPEIDYRQEKRRQSLKTDYQEHEEETTCHRRVSVPSNRTTPKKKPECGTHVVAKSELWDTGSQHRCQKNHQKVSRVSISQDEGKTSNSL